MHRHALFLLLLALRYVFLHVGYPEHLLLIGLSIAVVIEHGLFGVVVLRLELLLLKLLEYVLLCLIREHDVRLAASMARLVGHNCAYQLLFPLRRVE